MKSPVVAARRLKLVNRTKREQESSMPASSTLGLVHRCSADDRHDVLGPAARPSYRALQCNQRLIRCGGLALCLSGGVPAPLKASAAQRLLWGREAYSRERTTMEAQ